MINVFCLMIYQTFQVIFPQKRDLVKGEPQRF